MEHLLTVADYVRLPAVPADHRVSYGPHPDQFGDLYLPSTPQRPVPAVILLHGGCWRAQYGLSALGRMCAALREAGLAVWSMEYRRLGGGGGWPATFADAGAGADCLRGFADRYAVDLSRVAAMGHSAGGHLALWLAGRHRLPAGSDLFTPRPIAIRGVVSLAGIADLVEGVRRHICGGACEEVVGAAPAAVPDRYRQASPIALLPLGVPQWHIVGLADRLVPPDYVEHCAAAAGRHDDVHLDLVPDAGHFELVAPGSSAWTTVLRAALTATTSPSAT